MGRFVTAVSFSLLMTLSGCANPELSADSPETGVGQVAGVETLNGANAAVYTKDDTYDKLRFGKLNVNFVEVDAHRFVADWNDMSTYQSLRVGDKVSYSPTGRLIRVEGSGAKDGNYRQVIILKGK